MTWKLSAFADEAGATVEVQIAALKKAEMSRVDLRGVNGFNICDLPVEEAQKAADELNKAGITVGMFGSPIGKIDITDDFETDVKRLSHLGRLKDVLGCSAVRIFSYYNKKNAAHEIWQEVTVDRLGQLVGLAEHHGLVLYHENERHIFGDLVKDVCVLRDELHHAHPDRFKLIFDFDNFNQSGEDVWAAWEELREDTEAIHLKDSKRQPDGTYQHVPAGEGDGQIARILKDLADRDFDGLFTLEPHLTHSKAVAATGPSGEGSAELAALKPAESFDLAARYARRLFEGMGKWG